MEFVPLLVVAALLKKIVDFVRFALARDVNAAVTQVVSWVAGVGLMWLVSSSDFVNGVVIGGLNLGDLNAASIVLAGLAVSSTAGVGVDVIKAVDNTQSARVPSIIDDGPQQP